MMLNFFESALHMTSATHPTTESIGEGDFNRWRYGRVDGHFDECFDAGGEIRASWRRLLEHLSRIGREPLDRRWEQARRLIHENGVTYNVYSDPRGRDRPWQLDAVPLVVSSEEWKGIEEAVRQRARLLNGILVDLYGPRKLLLENRLPPELVFGNPGFHRPLDGIRCRNGIHLHLYAADLARSPTGEWWVVNDRTQAPSGAGYALENRMVMTRTLPDVFHECQVNRLSHFFGTLRDMLIGLSPSQRDRVRIVLLTPGPYNETYFEHAYLARYLGFTLAEGGDLTVRDHRVFLKTLSGLMPVDVILRRLDDGFCDPLELRDDSVLGIPGLVNAVRLGRVAVANALGSGVLDTPALLPFLPGLCRELLGEDIRMNGVATWWCGQPGPMSEVLAQLNRLVIKPAFSVPGREAMFGELLNERGLSELAEKIRAHPRDYVAQEKVALSTAPTWVDGRMQPRHVLLRVFAVATPDGDYRIMPGGLTRVSGAADSMVVSTQRGGGSKDTWVLSEKPVAPFSLLTHGERATELNRSGFILSSRVADNLFWLGRYVERLEGSIRVLRALLRRLNSEDYARTSPEVAGLVELLHRDGRLVGGVEGDEQERPIDLNEIEPQLISVIFDEDRPFSVRADVDRIHRIALTVRDRISADAWRNINQLSDNFVLPRVDEHVLLSATLELLDRTIITLAAFSGQSMEGMTREKGWRFLEIGRRLERAGNLASILEFGPMRVDDHESQRLEATLEIANSIMTYRSRYMSTFEAAAVMDLLILDETNPRSLGFQFARLQEHVEVLTADHTGTQRPREWRIITGLLTHVRLLDILGMMQTDGGAIRPRVGELIEMIRRQLLEFTEVLTRNYLSHARRVRPLGMITLES
ncbi:MAG: circularly permuted type 2 ATP-grasp protein [Phycisphaeraceae bacterium]|nr:circularly permuted type 2 ATP-grasp protein [Phycisphaeraceae bacterium]